MKKRYFYLNNSNEDMNNKLPRKRNMLVILGFGVWLTLICFFLWGILGTSSRSLALRGDDYFKETYKYFIQLTFIGLIGGVAVKEYERMRQKKSDLKEHRNNIYKSLVTVYLNTKRIRWNLRTSVKEYALENESFKIEINKLADIKTGFEVISSEINAYGKAFEHTEKAELVKCVNDMENYLGTITRTYAKPSTNTEQLTEIVRKFTEPDSEFGLKFRQPFKNAIAILTKKEEESTEPTI